MAGTLYALYNTLWLAINQTPHSMLLRRMYETCSHTHGHDWAFSISVANGLAF